MGYSIYIGEAVIKDDDDHVWLGVKQIEHPEAPFFPNDSMTGRTNGRHPSYGGWAEFTRETGLYDLFFDKENGLMAEHPGVAKLLPKHHARVKTALEFRQVVSKGAPGFPPMGKTDGSDPMLARLIWLEWWMRWALANCKCPALENS